MNKPFLSWAVLPRFCYWVWGVAGKRKEGTRKMLGWGGKKKGYIPPSCLFSTYLNMDV